jgi:hypothetical protein
MSVIKMLACIPVDTSDLPVVDEPIPVPTDLYIKDDCDRCGRGIWVGPRQERQRRQEPDTLALCYLCAVEAANMCTTHEMIDLGGGVGVEGTPLEVDRATPTPMYRMKPRDFPFTIEIFREDTGEIVWREVISGPGVLEVPGFGGSGFKVGVRTIYPDGRVETILPDRNN